MRSSLSLILALLAGGGCAAVVGEQSLEAPTSLRQYQHEEMWEQAMARTAAGARRDATPFRTPQVVGIRYVAVEEGEPAYERSWELRVPLPPGAMGERWAIDQLNAQAASVGARLIHTIHREPGELVAIAVGR